MSLWSNQGLCESFACSVLDALSEHIAVHDADGVIVAVNRGWRCFAADKAALPDNGSSLAQFGSNCLAVCRAAQEDTAQAAADGIADVPAGAARLSHTSLRATRRKPISASRRLPSSPPRG